MIFCTLFVVSMIIWIFFVKMFHDLKMTAFKFYFGSIGLFFILLFFFRTYLEQGFKILLFYSLLFLSNLTFGVYLIHDNSYVREVLYTNILHTRNYFNSNKYFAVAMISILAVFIVCCIIDYIRFLLFKLIIILCDKLSNKNKVLKS